MSCVRLSPPPEHDGAGVTLVFSIYLCVYSADLFCYRCGEQGHIARDCEQTEDGETPTATTTHYCLFLFLKSTFFL